MRIISIVVPLITGIGGIGIGWVLHSQLGSKTEYSNSTTFVSPPVAGSLVEESSPARSSAKPSLPPIEGSQPKSAKPLNPPANEVPTVFQAAGSQSQSGPAAKPNGASFENLSPAQYGSRLALLLTKTDNKEEAAERDQMIQGLTPERLQELYVDYMRRNGINRDASIDANLIKVLTDMGKKDGKVAMDAMLARFPGGFDRWDSLIHGWAIKDSQEAVTWFNELPEDLPRRDLALQGLMWGLAEKDGQYAGEVWKALDERDRISSAYGFASSFGWAHGLTKLDAWLTSAEPEVAKIAITKSMDYVSHRPPEESVPWMASHSDVLGLPPGLSSGFKQWVGTDPQKAFDWLASLPPTVTETPQIQQRLVKTVTDDKLDAFLKANPNHPAAQLITR